MLILKFLRTLSLLSNLRLLESIRRVFLTLIRLLTRINSEQLLISWWKNRHQNIQGQWKRRGNYWDAIFPIFKFSLVLKDVIYTTNTIESLSSTYRKLNNQKSVFPCDTVLLKALYLQTIFLSLA